MSGIARLERRVHRGASHVELASSHRQPPTDRLASALADLRAWAAAEGVPFAEAIELSRTQYIQSRVMEVSP